MGYGTPPHMAGIRQYGITQWHRRSYGLCKRKLNECKKYSGEDELPIYDLSVIERQERLEFGKKYTSTRELRYGKLVIM